MWNCKKCNEEIIDTLATCWNCGLKRNESEVGAPVSSYDTIRTISNIIYFIGWLLIVGGVLIAFFDLTEEGSRDEVIASLILASNGLVISVSGLFILAYGQIIIAIVDNANHTKEILRIMKEKS